MSLKHWTLNTVILHLQKLLSFMLNLKEKGPQGLNPTQRTVGMWGKLRAGRVVFPEKSTPIACPLPNGQS